MGVVAADGHRGITLLEYIFLPKYLRPTELCHTEYDDEMTPEDDLAQEKTHDLEMKFNKIAPLGKEDTAESDQGEVQIEEVVVADGHRGITLLEYIFLPKYLRPTEL